MRSRLRPAILAAIALASTACEPTVIIERDETVRIPSGASWSWSTADGDGPSAAQGEVVPPPDIHDRLSDAIAQGLEARGFRLTTPDAAEFFVHFHLARREVVDTIPRTDAPRAVGDRDPQDWGRYGDPEQMRERTMTWQEGLLVVDALTADGRKVAWRGIIYGEIKPQAERDPTSAIRGAVERLLAEFP